MHFKSKFYFLISDYYFNIILYIYNLIYLFCFLEKFLEVEKRIFNVTHSFKYSSLSKIENIDIDKYVKVINIIKDYFNFVLYELTFSYKNFKNSDNRNFYL